MDAPPISVEVVSKERGPMEGNIGDGLLPPNLGEGREELVVSMQAAAARIMGAPLQNFQTFLTVFHQAKEIVKDRYTRAGLHGPPGDKEAFWQSLRVGDSPGDPERAIRLVRALLTDATATFCEHYRYRMRYAANVHLEINGGTGLAKSSCAIALADWCSHIGPGRLPRHINLDVAELPKKLVALTAGEMAIQDELLETSGEGSRTTRVQFQNAAETMRASQVHLTVITPEPKDRSVIQIRLEAFLWNPEKGWTVFLWWKGDALLGVVALPWAPAELWAQYGPFKAFSVARSCSGAFNDRVRTVRLAMEVLDDPRAEQLLVRKSGIPKKMDFERVVKYFSPGMLSGGQVESVADVLYDLAMEYEALHELMEPLWNVQPTAALERLAQKCKGQTRAGRRSAPA